jgi:hypothetical protein
VIPSRRAKPIRRRRDFAIIGDELEAIHAQLVRLPTEVDLWRVALMGTLGGAGLVQALAFLFR